MLKLEKYQKLGLIAFGLMLLGFMFNQLEMKVLSTPIFIISWLVLLRAIFEDPILWLLNLFDKSKESS